MVPMLQVVKPLPLLMKTDTFIIDTPHIGATKWWIGGAAHSATHTVCYARLIVKDVDYGVKTFVVPLRDSNHNLLPGVAIGDIGAKMGDMVSITVGFNSLKLEFQDFHVTKMV